jgi:Putative mono-oxygenase ydhR
MQFGKWSDRMALMILQVDFVDDRLWDISEKNTALLELAHKIADTPGLIWKVWTENPETQEAGGVYLFEDEASLEAYLALHTQRLRGMGIRQVNAKKFQVNTPLTHITYGTTYGQLQR